MTLQTKPATTADLGLRCGGAGSRSRIRHPWFLCLARSLRLPSLRVPPVTVV